MAAPGKPKLILYTPLLSATGGGQHAMTRLAIALQARGYPIVLAAQPPFTESHRYVQWLRTAGIPIELLPGEDEGPGFRAFRLALRLVASVPYAVVRRRALGAAWFSLGEIARTAHMRRHYRTIQRTFSRLAGGEPAILHIWGPTAMTPVLLEWAEQQHVPAIYHEMGEGDAKYVTDWGLTRTVESIGSAARVVCCSPSVARNIAATYGYAGPIDTIPFMIEDPPDNPPARVPGPAVVFGAIGRLVPHKRQGELIHALRALRDEGCPVELLIAGSGPSRQDLETLARDLGIAQHVRFTGEFEDLASVMAQFDVFALTSVSESQCMPITESMAYGKPVIASRFGGMPDFVQDGVTGLLVELEDRESLIAAMRALATDAGLRQRLGAAGRAAYLANYTESSVVARFEDVYGAVGAFSGDQPR